MTALPISFIDNVEALRQLYAQPAKGAAAKEIGHLHAHFSNFIERSPFVCISSMSADGRADVSPRGGEAGFVHVLDPTHLAIPDRPGNNRLDSLVNIIANPSVGLLFFVPGFEDMLRVNGTARITTDPALMARFVANGRLPASVILIEVNEAQTHCAKAIRRAGLWNPATFADRRSFPTTGQILKDVLAVETPVEAIDAMVEKDARERLY
jgi:PPOX class probable FMN-dependent enzyme